LGLFLTCFDIKMKNREFTISPYLLIETTVFNQFSKNAKNRLFRRVKKFFFCNGPSDPFFCTGMLASGPAQPGSFLTAKTSLFTNKHSPFLNFPFRVPNSAHRTGLP